MNKAKCPSSGEAIGGVATVVHAGSSSLGEFGDAALHDDPVIAAQLREWRDLPQVAWRLWVGPDRLPRRVHLTSTYPMAEDKRLETAVIEVDFTDWGSDVLIAPHRRTRCTRPGLVWTRSHTEPLELQPRQRLVEHELGDSVGHRLRPQRRRDPAADRLPVEHARRVHSSGGASVVSMGRSSRLRAILA